MARLIEWGGQPFAVLVEDAGGSFLVPPIVRNEAGEVVEGAEVLAAIIESGVAIEIPVIHNASAAMLAEIDQRMAHISEQLGVPIGAP